MVTVKSTRGSKAAEAALEKFKGEFAKSFGKDTLLHSKRIDPYKIISTGSVALDFALGSGGIILGSLVEIWGVDGTGKTTLALIQAAQAQKAYPNRFVAFLDMEHKLDRRWAQTLGVDLDRLFHIQPETAEVLADQVKDLIMSDLVSLVIIDSIGSMVNQAEKEEDAEKRSVGTTPAIITRMVKIAASEAKAHGCAVYILNQTRAVIAAGPGPDSTTGGGFALKHATVHRIHARRAAQGTLTVGSGVDAVQVGQKVALKIQKNGVSTPGRTAVVTLITHPSAKYGTQIGIGDLEQEAFSTAKKAGLLVREKGKYVLPVGGELVASEEKYVAALRDDPKQLDALWQVVVKAAQSGLSEADAGEIPVEEMIEDVNAVIAPAETPETPETPAATSTEEASDVDY